MAKKNKQYQFESKSFGYDNIILLHLYSVHLYSVPTAGSLTRSSHKQSSKGFTMLVDETDL